ncbi:rCG49375 [Rattus norvegicus]|uniref:RCG49375 n=1 Tax=Rattus norvegicus TaxID=10116 RepID=A6J2N1_RAT|nr:rCG49375 [Rattus norvegicus]
MSSVKRKLLMLLLCPKQRGAYRNLLKTSVRAEGACNTIKTTIPINQSSQGPNHYPKSSHGSSCICSRG